MEVVTDFFFLGSKISADVTEAMKSDDYFLAGKLWQTDITLLTKVYIV